MRGWFMISVLLACAAFAGETTVDDVFTVEARLHDYDLSSVDQFLEAARPRYSNNGCVKIIKDGRVLLRKAYGDWTVFKTVPIGSSTKWLSGTMIMSLIDAGKMDMNMNAGQFFPAFTGTHRLMTVRQMFSHTCGLPFSAPDTFDPPNYIPNQDKDLPSMQACVDIIATVPLDPHCDPPGTGFHYGSMGMQVAGRIAEIQSGKGWEQLFMDLVGAPLGMTRSNYHAFGATANPNVGGGMESNVDELGDLVWTIANQGVFKGQQVLSKQAVETMLTNQTGNLPIVSSPTTGLEEKFGLTAWRYGIGCWLEKFDPATGEAWEVSSGGLFGCAPFVDLKRNLAGVFLPRSYNVLTLPSGKTYRDEFAVYLEMKQMLQGIVPEDTVLDVLQNDANPPGLKIVQVTQPGHGTVVLRWNRITYTPAVGFVGQDSFTYTVDQGSGSLSTATVVVNVSSKPEIDSEPSATPNPIELR